MNAYIALLRGINVGGRNILPMKDLLAIFNQMGFIDTKSYIQSGNVVFKSKTVCTDKTITKMKSKIKQNKGFEPNIHILSASELIEVIKKSPYKVTDGKTLHFGFLKSKPQAPDLSKLNALKTDSEQFKLDGRVFYLYAPDGIGRSKLAANIEKCLGVSVTSRNLNTVNKLSSMVEGGVMERLFVYGTLGPGRPNEHILADIGGSWSDATLMGILRQEGWGAEMGYPGIVLDDRLKVLYFALKIWPNTGKC